MTREIVSADDDAGEITSAETDVVRGDLEHSVSAPPDQRDADRTLSHEEFDPRGTLALILLYFAILAVMWVFMYFVEFLGNGPTVVG